MASFTVTSATSATWEAPANVSKVTVRVWGGGGGGQNGTLFVGENGGGGGAYSTTVDYAVIAGVFYNYTVGAGGNNSGSGVDGGDSFFDSSTDVMAKGGRQGSNRSGGAAGSGFGDTKFSGGQGGIGIPGLGGGGGGSAGTGSNGNNALGAIGGIAVTNGGVGGTSLPFLPGGGGGAPGGAGAGGPNLLNGGDGADGRMELEWEPDPVTDNAIFFAANF